MCCILFYHDYDIQFYLRNGYNSHLEPKVLIVINSHLHLTVVPEKGQVNHFQLIYTSFRVNFSYCCCCSGLCSHSPEGEVDPRMEDPPADRQRVVPL